MIFDGHSDLLWDVVRRRRRGETNVLERHHLARLRQGGIEGLTLALWADPAPGETYAQKLEELMVCARAEFAESPWLRTVRTAAEAEAAKAAGQMYSFLSVEGMAAIGADLDRIDRLAEFGVRMGMLTWNEENLLATGAKGDRYSGLTELGKKAVRRMEAQRMLPDVSHLNDGGFADVARIAQGRVIASHSNCRKLCDVPRNLTDEQLRAIRDAGGVVGLNVHHAFVHADARQQTAETLSHHAAHMAEVMGVEHVACGFDFCEFFGPGNEGAEGLESCAHVKNLFYWLEKRGFTGEEIARIARENFLRALA